MFLQVCVETMMHLTCTNMPQSELENALDKVSCYSSDAIVLVTCKLASRGASRV